MSEPYNTFYKDRLYYQRTLYNEADSLKDNFIKEEEARVRYRRSKNKGDKNKA